MKKQRNEHGPVARFCNYLGRQNFASKLLDHLANKLIPPPAPAYSGAQDLPVTVTVKSADSLSSTRPFLMSPRPTAPHSGMAGQTAPTTPHGPSLPEEPGFFAWLFSTALHHSGKKIKAKHAAAVCSTPRYHGMHGRPCKFAGGTDNKCPRGTVSGWFWAWDVPALGRVYYVDCCGGTPTANAPWCNWTAEPNWCLGNGRAVGRGVTSYNCTLAILEVDMNVTDLGGGTYEVTGVDP